MNLPILLTLGISFVASSVTTPSLIPWLSSRMLDRPNNRSSHVVPIPRGGGVVFVSISSTFALACLVTHSGISSSLPLIAFPLAVVGWVDDWSDLPASLRFVVQLFTSFMMVWLSPLPMSPWVFPILVISAVAFINFSNFMDGLDGLLTSCLSIALATAALMLDVGLPIWSLLGALLGFLLWNWSPAKVFMGDVGSTFLGAVFAGLVLQSTSWYQAFSLLLVSSPTIGDAFVTVLRRFVSGQPVFQAHRQHLFQRLNQAGWSHASVACSYLGATFLMAAVLFFVGLNSAVLLLLVLILLAWWLDRQVAVPFGT